MSAERYLTHAGLTLSIKQWAKRLGHSNNQTIHQRLHRGWSIEATLIPLIEKRIYLTHKGITKLRSEWAAEIGISDDQLRTRLTKMTLVKALETPPDLRKGRYLSHNGETLLLGEWAKRKGIDRSYLRKLLLIYTVEEALSLPSFNRSAHVTKINLRRHEVARRAKTEDDIRRFGLVPSQRKLPLTAESALEAYRQGSNIHDIAIQFGWGSSSILRLLQQLPQYRELRRIRKYYYEAVHSGDLAKRIRDNALKVTRDGETHTILEWAKIRNVDHTTLYQRMKTMSPEEAVTSRPKWEGHPRQNPLKVTCDGETHTIYEWAKIRRISHATIYDRIYRGISPEEAVRHGKRK